MTALSTSLRQPAANEDFTRVYVPFTAFVKITPIRGKRFETIRDCERIAQEVEDDIATLCGSTELIAFDYAKPIAYTPAFGDKTARLTITGNACALAAFTSTPVGKQNVDSDNKEQTGVGAGNASNRVPDAQTDALCKSLKVAIESAISGVVGAGSIYRLEIAGYIYGVSGTSFPR